jgi:hypothetical protein
MATTIKHTEREILDAILTDSQSIFTKTLVGEGRLVLVVAVVFLVTVNCCPWLRHCASTKTDRADFSKASRLIFCL